MINIGDLKKCCGCSSCVQKCPKKCIELYEDYEGFLYPKVKKDICIDCGICEKTCPELNQGKFRFPKLVYAAKNTDEKIRMDSSSGGVFTLLAVAVLSSGGVVFGAKFDLNWEVVHGYTETIEGLSDFRGSKYVQSKIGWSYQQAETFLKAGRKVLFSGTPCQISGLRLFLKQEYDNLLSVDFVCHGVPSPKVWRMYLDELLAREEYFKSSSALDRRSINNIKFRDKRLGWKTYSFTIHFLDKSNMNDSEKYFSESLAKNIFMKGFLSDLYLRPSCHACPAKKGKSQSDITIGDYWGIQNVNPKFDDDKGISLIMIGSDKGDFAYSTLLIDAIETSYLDAFRGNSAMEISPDASGRRAIFFNQMNNLPLFPLITKLTYISFKIRLKRKLIAFMRRGFLLCFSKIKKIK